MEEAAGKSDLIETDLDALSNRANALIRQGQWAPAQAICERLREEFPDEIDADERLAQLYEAQGKWTQALVPAQAALDQARRHPDKFDPELVTDLEEHLVFLKSKAVP
jgi:tetratricopeptide (TPR) repeat protein